jgi:hypothetical protein
VLIFQLGFGAYVAFIAGRQSYLDAQEFVTYVPTPIRGIWSVEEFVIDGTPRAPLLTDTDRWQQVIFETSKQLTIQAMDGKQTNYYLQFDSGKNTATLRKLDDPHWKAMLSVENPQSDRLTLAGQFGAHQVTANLNRVDLSDPTKFYLVNKGFHWVNPYVDNR